MEDIYEIAEPAYLSLFRTELRKEIAKRLPISAKTVENKLKRGRAKLKKQLLKSGISAA